MLHYITYYATSNRLLSVKHINAPDSRTTARVKTSIDSAKEDASSVTNRLSGHEREKRSIQKHRLLGYTSCICVAFKEFRDTNHNDDTEKRLILTINTSAE